MFPRVSANTKCDAATFHMIIYLVVNSKIFLKKAGQTTLNLLVDVNMIYDVQLNFVL